MLNFGPSRGTAWIWLTLATALSVLGSLVLALVSRLLARRFRADDRGPSGEW